MMARRRDGMRRVCVRAVALAAGGLLLAGVSACSFSDSSRSSSSPSRSSSRSSRQTSGGVAVAKGTFQEEIAAIAVLYVNNGGTSDDFLRDIGATARRQGIPSWETDRRVYVAIGRGLQRAGVKRDAIPYLPFLQGIRNAQHFDAVVRGA
jgi:hypothetical protein